MLEIMGELFPEAPVHTLAHQAGAILGHLELRPVRSTGLSRATRDLNDLAARAFMLPGLVSQVHVPCQVNLVFNVSHGLSHGISKCKDTKLWTYLYDDDLLVRPPQTLKERLFRPYVRHWARKQLAQIDLLWVPTEGMKQELSRWTRAEIEVVPPFFKLSDYPLIPSSTFKRDFYLIHALGLTLKEAELIVSIMEERKTRFRFFGENPELASLREKLGEEAFFGERCAGELAPMLAASRGVIDFDLRSFPSESLKALSQGRRVIRRSGARGESFLSHEYTHSCAPTKTALSDALDEVDRLYQDDQPQKIRAKAMDFHDLKFKGALQRTLQRWS